MVNTYEVEEVCLGEDKGGNHILFKTVDEMDKAYYDLNNGADILVIKDGVATKIPNQLLNVAVYTGKLKLSAKARGI